MCSIVVEKIGFRDLTKVFNFFEPHSTHLLNVDNGRNVFLCVCRIYVLIKMEKGK